MTLFAWATGHEACFSEALARFYESEEDQRILVLLGVTAN